MEQKIKEKTIIQILEKKANQYPNKIAYGMLDSNLNTSEITYSELLFKVKQYAQNLNIHGISNGEKCLLLFPQGLDFIISFLACNWNGIVPVPLNIPGRNKSLDKWEKIANDCNARAILTGKSTHQYLTNTLNKSQHLSSMQLLGINHNITKPGIPAKGYNKLTFLQYTSGSTGNPKGVMVTHKAIMRNLEEVKKRLVFSSHSIMVSWLPFYHDMGLILAILQALYTGFTLYLMSPQDFMNQPMLWLRAISVLKATHTGNPNFAFELVADKLENSLKEGKNEDLSLEYLQKMICGAEPIHLSSLLKFKKIASKYGLKEGVICPAYGLAEATLVISTHDTASNVNWLELDNAELQDSVVKINNNGNLKTTTWDEIQNSDSKKYLVSNGTVIENHQMLIRDTKTGAFLPPYKIGELCFYGESVTKGYLHNPGATRQNYIKVKGASKPYLRTGDLGFIDANGEFYITGRIKDIIIIKGLNHYPQDIERTAFTSSEFMRIDGAAAFSITEDNQEKLILIQELTRSAVKNPQYSLWVEKIKEEILKKHEITIEAILFVPPMHVPRTTSGKIQRSKARLMYQNNEWKKILYSYKKEKYNYQFIDTCTHSEDSLKDFISFLVVNQLDMPLNNLETDHPFVEMGITSLMSLYIRDELEKVLKVKVSSTTLFNHNTINNLAKELWNKINAPGEKPLGKNNEFLESTIPGGENENYDNCSEEELMNLLANELKDL